MKYKRTMAALCVAAAALFILTGCQLAREDQGADAGQDRLVGMLITTEYLDLFDFEGYMNDNIGKISDGEVILDGDSEQYQGRLYATTVDRTFTNEQTGQISQTQEYVFEDVDGMFFYSATVPATAEHESYFTSGSDEAVSDRYTSLNCGDEGDSVSLEGTVYAVPAGDERTYYFNPVYQSADGSVYAVSGSGFCSGVTDYEGSSYSHTMSESYTTTENGETITDSISIKISFNMMYPPEKIVIMQMDEASAVVSRTQYDPEEVPQTVTPGENTEYIVVEIHKTDSKGNEVTARTLYGRDAAYLDSFYCRQDGICIKRMTQIEWPQQSPTYVQ